MQDIFKKLLSDNIFKEIINHSKFGVNIVDDSGVLLYCNTSSAKYIEQKPEDMIGNPVVDYYPQAVLMNVLDKGIAYNNQMILHTNGNKYIVDAYPIFEGKRLLGGYAIFQDITVLDKLNDRIDYLETILNEDKMNVFPQIIGSDLSLSDVVKRAKRTVASLGGPRHCIITGESGTGKTMLAKAIYEYAKKIGVIREEAPFIAINCAQFTNSDIAAMEIFGSSEGAYTGSKNKKGLFELADGGFLFLDEAHALDHYQNLLLKAIESGTIKRIGGTKDISVNVMVIAASTKNLKEVFLPELYQRLAQYELFLPALRDRSRLEKMQIFNSFIKNYEINAKNIYDINLKITFTSEAENILMNNIYPRNIRQFRDVVNATIDSAVPLVTSIQEMHHVNTLVKKEHIAFEVLERENAGEKTENDIASKAKHINNLTRPLDNSHLDDIIKKMVQNKLGPRKIANRLKEAGYPIEYYQVAYKIKKFKLEKV